MGKESRLLLLCIFLGISNLFGQSTTGNIEGWIFNEKYQPISDVNIIISSTSLQGIKGTSSNSHGYFIVAAVPVGTYNLRLTHILYQTITLNNIHVSLEKTTSIGEIHMYKKTLETEAVIVSGDKPVLDTRSTTNGEIISAKQFDKLPLERNYFQMAELFPHANISFKGDGGINFAGSTGIENRYFVDGAEVTSPTFGGVLFELPNNFIREVEVRTGDYQAEYQSSLGGIINTVTFSGGNEFHGKIFGFFTNNNFSKAPRISAVQPPSGSYSNFDIGFGFGGSIVKDRLWYYLAYDPNTVSEDVHVNGLGMQNSYLNEHKFAGKLTWSINRNNILTLSFCGDPYSGRNVSSSSELKVLNPEYCSTDVDFLSVSSILKGIHKLSNIFFLETSFSTGTLHETIKPAFAGGSQPWFDDYVSGTSSGGVGFIQNKPAINQLNGSVKGTLSIDNHIIKAGFEYTQNSTTRDSRQQGMEHFQDAYLTFDILTKGTVKQNNFTAFVQDSWQIHPRFCLNLGVRWDPQWLIDSDGSVAQKITNQVQPRIGIIYQPGKIGTQKITASFGRFYQPVMLALSIIYHIKDSYFNYTIYPNDPRIDTSGAQFIPNLNPYVSNIPDLNGQYYDEFSLGYKSLISYQFKFGIRGIYRSFGKGIEDGQISEADQAKYGSREVYGNPGSGPLYMFPKMKRNYTAIEITLERFSNSGFNFLLSYVLSRNWGNYDGLAETSDITGGSGVGANITGQFELPERMKNIEGLLPNDRTHVFKFSGSYGFRFGLTTGIIFQWMSGTPLNEFGVIPVYRSSTFLQPRGTAGRTPSIWDLNFRLMYDLSNLISLIPSANVILDILHVASRRTALDYDQYHYLDPGQTEINPNYMSPIQFQPPMSLRLGMEITL